jgi:hypothetical protein
MKVLRIEGEELVFYLEEQPIYFIPLMEVREPLDLLSWIHQLLEKTWMDADLMREFIETICARRGWAFEKAGGPNPLT